MNVSTGSAARAARGTAALTRVWRASLGVLVLLVVETGTGMYVNSDVTVPKADHGGSLSTAIKNGPAMLGLHAVIGLLLGLGALGVLVQAVLARHWGVVALSAVGLFALAFASVSGTSFTSSGDSADSTAMTVMTGLALVCYAVNLYVLRPDRLNA